MAAQGNIIGLSEAIEALREALTAATEKGQGQRMRFRLEPVELTLQAVVTKDANGKIGWGALGVGGSYESAETQTLRLKLYPLWQTPEGELVDDFLVAHQSDQPVHLGPRQVG